MKIALAAATLGLLMSSCFFSFERGNDLQPGDVSGRAVDENNDVIAFADVRIEGSTRIVKADAQGNFLVRGLSAGAWVLRLSIDQNGDGYAERGRVLPFQVRFGSVGGDNIVGGVELGDVTLRPVASVSGQVVMPENDDTRSEARVVAIRRFDNAPVQSAEGQTSASFSEVLAAEAAVGTADGAFVFPALAEGRVQLIAEYNDPQSGELLMAQSAFLDLAPNQRIDNVVLTLQRPLAIDRRAVVHVSPEPSAGALIKIAFRSPGENAFVFPTELDPNDPEVRPYDGPIVLTNVVPGRQDLVVITEESSAFSPSRLIPADLENVEFHVELREINNCLERDCDDDDIQALCPYGELCENLLTCAAQCADAFGEAAQTITCRQNDEVFDCDDDGDGQPDTTEPPACLGTLFGTDFDGDGICSTADPIPQCAQAFDPVCFTDPAPTPLRPGPFAGYDENEAPTLIGQSEARARPNTTEVFQLAGLFADPEDDALRVILPRPLSLAGGEVALENADEISQARLLYTPPQNFDGIDEIDLAVSDGVNIVALTFIVRFSDGDAPTLVPDEVSLNEDESIAFDLLGNDDSGDADFVLSTLNVIVPPDFPHSLVVDENAQVVFTPAPNFFTRDDERVRFEYTIENALGLISLPAEVRIEVLPVDDPVTIADTEFTSDEDRDFRVDLRDLINDVDNIANVEAAQVVTPPVQGSVVNRNGILTYTPLPDFAGEDAFVVEVFQDDGNLLTIPFTLNIAPRNDRPIGSNNNAAGETDIPFSIELSQLFSDVDEGDTLTFSIESQDPGVSASIAGGLLSVQADFAGRFTIVVQATDQAGLSARSTLVFFVDQSNTPPMPQPDFANGVEDSGAIIVDVLANDSDAENNIERIELILAPSGASVVNNQVVFTPAENQNGEVTFGYRVFDAEGLSNDSSVTIDIAAVDDPPIVEGETVTGAEDEADLVIDIVANDSDVDDILEYSFGDLTPPAATLPVFNGTTLTWDPPDNVSGTFSYEYEVTAGAITRQANAIFIVEPRNDLPLLSPIERVLDEDDPALTIEGLDFVTEPDGEALTFSYGPVQQTEAGVISANGSEVTFTPAENFCAPEVFVDYAVTAGADTVNSTIRLVINCVNDAPPAQDERVETQVNNDQPLVIDLLANEENVDEGEVLTATLDNGQTIANATFVSFENDRTLSLIVDPNFQGEIVVPYSVSDGSALAPQSAALTVAVTGLVVQGESVNKDEDDLVAFDIDCAANDSDSDNNILNYTFDLTGISASQAAVVSNGGVLSITLAENFCGVITIPYDVSSPLGTASSNAVIDVACLPDVPVAVNDAFLSLVEDEGRPHIFNILSNDSDADIDAANALLVNPITLSPPPFVTLLPDNTLQFNPPDNFNGAFSFDYTITDNAGLSATATVSVSVAPRNDLPVVGDDFLSFDEDEFPSGTNITALLLANDSDPDGNLDPSSIAPALGVQLPASISFAGGEFTFTSPPDFNSDVGGNVVFTYAISDLDNNRDNATVTITVDPVRDDPVLIADPNIASGDENSAVVINFDVLENDIDVDGLLRPNTLALLPPSESGMNVVNGAIQFVPQADRFGEITFEYRVLDDENTERTSTGSVFINPAPQAQDVVVAFNESELDSLTPLDLLNNVTDRLGTGVEVFDVAQTLPAAFGTLSNVGNDVEFLSTFAPFAPTDVTYTVRHSNGSPTALESATITISVNGVPVAATDSTNVPANVVDFSIDVLANDSDFENETLRVVNANVSPNGSVTFNDDEVFFTAEPGVGGTVTIGYEIVDEQGQNAFGTHTVIVDEPPVVVDDDFRILQGPNTLLVSGNDGPAATLVITEQPLSGITATVNGLNIDYAPPSTFSGRDQLKYRIESAQGSPSIEATVNLEVLKESEDLGALFEGGPNVFSPAAFFPVRRHAMAMGPVNVGASTAVAFGGSDGLEVFNDTYVYDGTSWSQITPATTPPARAFAAFAASEAGFVMYGGIDANNDVLDDMWRFDGSDWSQIGDTVPGKLFGASLSYSSANEALYLFGGEDESGVLSNSFHIFRNSTETWAPLAPQGQAATARRFATFTLLFDTFDDAFWLLAGGETEFGVTSESNIVNVLDLDDDMFVSFALEQLPNPVSGHRIEKTGNDSIVLFEGLSRNAFAFFDEPRASGRTFTNADITQSTQWIFRDEQPSRTAFMGTFEEGGDVLITGGDVNLSLNAQPNDETLRIDLENNIVVEQVTAAHPGSRTHAHVAEVPGGVMLFGGCTGPTTCLDDTWRWDAPTQTWTDVSATLRPSNIRQGAIAYSPTLDRVILHGGEAGGLVLNETWSFNPNDNQWTQVVDNTAPQLHKSKMAYDLTGDRLIMFGGLTEESIYDPDTYAFDGTVWSVVSTSQKGSPLGREAHFMVSGNIGGFGRLIMGYGLRDEGFAIANSQVYEWNSALNEWNETTFSTPNDPDFPTFDSLVETSVVFDPINEQFVFAFGNKYAGSTDVSFLTDALTLVKSGATYAFAREPELSGEPTFNAERRENANAAFDGQSMLLFGGTAFEKTGF